MEDKATKSNEAYRLFNDGKYTEAFAIYKELADQGDPIAQNYMGLLYSGEYDKSLRDLKKSVEYYKLAADQNNTTAMSNLGYCICNGIGCKKDAYIGGLYQKRAADDGLAFANNSYGVLLLNGDGVNKSITGALQHYRIAAKGGNTYAKQNIEDLSRIYRLDEDDRIDVKSYSMSKLLRILLTIMLAIGLGIFNIMFDAEPPVYGIIASHFLTCLCILLILMRQRLGGVLLTRVVPVMSVLLSLYFVFTFEGYKIETIETVLIALLSIISPLVAFFILQIKCKKVPYWNTLMNIPYDGLGLWGRKMKRYYDYGFTQEYQIDSPETSKFKRFYNSRTLLIGAIGVLAAALIFITDGYMNFHLEWNFFKSWAAGPLYFIGLLLTLFNKLSIFQTWIVTKDEFGNEKSRKRSNDMTDAVSDGFIMPLLQRFVAYPLGVAVPVYYVVVLVLHIFEPFMPFLAFLIFLSIVIFYKNRFISLSRRLNRNASANLLCVSLSSSIVLILVAWLFFSVNKLSPYIGTFSSQKEYAEQVEASSVAEIKYLSGQALDDIPGSIKGVYDRYEFVTGDDDASYCNFYLDDKMVMEGICGDMGTLSGLTIYGDNVPCDCRAKPGGQAINLFYYDAELSSDYTGFQLDGYYVTVTGMTESFKRKQQECYNKGTKLKLEESDFDDNSVVVSIFYH